MAITDNESAFVDSSAVSIGLSQMFTVTAGSTDPAYLVLSVLDRNEYTAAGSGATGSLSGNGNTLGLSSLSGDERGTGILFTYTYNSATGQYAYYNSTYGWFNQVSYTSSSSAGDVTDLSLFGTSNLAVASLFASNPYLMMEDDPSGYLGGATVVTQPGYTATVPAQATPDSIAAVAKTFVGDAWNLNGCWVLASTIAAEAGTSLPEQSTLIGLTGQAGGEWIVAFNGPAGQTGNWQNMVTAGEMIVFQPAGGGGHVTTCVSGSGSTAMLVDNAEYVNGSGQIQNPANDGSSSDIIIAAPHLASQEWAGVAASSVVIYELDTPIVTATVSSDTLAGLTTQSLGSLFSVTDPANKAITAWQVYDTASSDSLVLGGTSYGDHSAATALNAPTLGAVSLLAGATAMTDTLEVRAYNGSYWGDWDALTVTITAAAAPPPSAPVLETQTPNQTWTGGTAVSLTLPATTFADPQGETLAYTATQQNGQALPGWLTFNAAADTFSGTAPATAQTLNLKVTATDTSGLSVSDGFSATIIGAPLLETQTPNQTWTGGTAVSMTLPATTFADPQGETLTYTAAQQNGQALPGWLTFNAATDAFSGTAPATAQTVALKVTGTDTSGLSVSDSFSATVIGAPVLETETPNQTWTGGTAVSLTVPATTFADPQGEALAYRATQQNGQALPGWLTFNATTGAFSGTAPATAQTLNLVVAATDTSGLAVSDGFSATVIGAPVLETQTPNQTWTGGTAVSLTLPATTFADPQGEALAYTATQQNGQALPGWLTFNAATDAFSGIAPLTAQTLNLVVTATDTSGLSVSDSFATTVIGAPLLATQTPSQTWTGGTAVSLTLPVTTFADPQGEALAYTATQQNGQALPGWLTFNAATDAFSGTAPATAQTLNLDVTATDTSGLSVSDSFATTVIGAPLLETQTPTQTWTGGTAVSLTLPATTFADPQGEALTYTAMQQNGQALPGWLTFNAATDAFSGIAPLTAQTLNLVVTATDTSGLSVSDSFATTVIGAPLLATQTPSQTWTGGTAVSLTLPATTFADPQGEALTYTATQQNGQALPGWLTFNAATDAFSGTAPAAAQTLNLVVTATDTSGLSVSDSFSATVIGAPLLETQTPNQTWTGGTAVSLTLPASTFADPQGQTLAYTASQQNGQALPGWLTFNAATDTFCGTAPATAQTLNLEVTATDTSGLPVTDSFSATVTVAPIYLTRVPTILTGGGENDVFVATNNVLYSGDKITGGGGVNTLELQGGGTFDLRAPTVLNNIQVVDATEGQSAGLPTIYLRNGLDLTLNLASAVTNPQSSEAMIHGANNNDMINLGSGTDTVWLGGTGETVNGGSGNDTFDVTGLTIGATIAGGGGTDNLNVQGGGTAVMGANITGIDNVFLQSAGSSYNFTANATQGLAIHAGADNATVTAGDASQTVIGSTGTLRVLATAATAGVAVKGSTGGAVLEITTGGTIALNSADNNISVQLDAASTLLLPTNATVAVAGGAGNDVFVATAGVLRTGQQINGGAGVNTLDLEGGGTFNLAAPSVLSNIQVVDATEGQSAGQPKITLRNGTDLTLNLASASTNPQLSGAVVYGANNDDVINLGSGNDTVSLGGTGETVNGGSGTDTFDVTGLTIGATIAGGSGTDNLDVQGGGSAAMGANITGIDSVFLQNAGTSYNFTANATQGLAIHASTDSDTITVGSASQTVIGSSGNLLVLASAATGGAAVKGGTGSAMLEITTSGTVALNSADNNITVQLEAASTTLQLNRMAFIQAEGTGGSDVIIAGGKGQMLTGGGGNDTLEDAGHYGVTFQDTVAGFSGDTLADFTKVDTIDIIGFGSASAVAGYAGTYGATGSGVLAVTNGTGTVDIKMSGLAAGASFHTASDLNGGTLITYS